MRQPHEREGWTGADGEEENENYMRSGIWRLWNCRKMHGIEERGCLGGRDKLGSSLSHRFLFLTDSWVISLTSLNLSFRGFEIRQIKCITNNCQNQDSEEQWRHILANIYWGSPQQNHSRVTTKPLFGCILHITHIDLGPHCSHQWLSPADLRPSWFFLTSYL